MKNIKRLLCICLIACICFCVVGCNKVNDNNSSGLSSMTIQTEMGSVDNEKEGNIENIKEILNIKRENIGVCDFDFKELDRIVDFTYFFGGEGNEHHFAITEDGKLYEISLKKPFSNNKHYKEIQYERDCHFEKFFEATNGLLILDNTNHFIYFNGSEFNPPLRQPEPIESYSGDFRYIFNGEGVYLNHLIIKNNDIIKTMRQGYYDFNSNEVICSIPKEETIEQVWDGGIKTNKQWYFIETTQTNKEECKKYADVIPEYKYELKSLKFNFNVVLCKYNGRYIIDENNTIYECVV